MKRILLGLGAASFALLSGIAAQGGTLADRLLVDAVVNHPDTRAGVRHAKDACGKTLDVAPNISEAAPLDGEMDEAGLSDRDELAASHARVCRAALEGIAQLCTRNADAANLNDYLPRQAVWSQIDHVSCGARFSGGLIASRQGRTLLVTAAYNSDPQDNASTIAARLETLLD